MKKIVLFFTLAVASFVSANLHAESVSLSLNPEVGTEQHLVVDYDLKVYLDMSDKVKDEIKATLEKEQKDIYLQLFYQALLNLDQNTPAFELKMETDDKVTIQGKCDNGDVAVLNETENLSVTLKEPFFNTHIAFDSRDLENITLETNAPGATPEMLFIVKEEAKKRSLSLGKYQFLIATNGIVKKVEQLSQAELGGTLLTDFALIAPPSKLTVILLPEHPVEVGETWNQKMIACSDELFKDVPEAYRPVLKLLDQQVTLKERSNGIVTLEVVQPVEQLINIKGITNEEITFSGTLFTATLKIDEKSGIVKEGEFATDFSVKLTGNKELLNGGEISLNEELLNGGEITLRIVCHSNLKAQ